MIGADTVCVVVGATGGIGRAIVVELARRGARVWAVGRDGDKLEALAGDVAATPGVVRTLGLDLTNDEELRAALERIREDDALDVLIHAQGAIAVGSFADVSLDDIDRQLDVNLRAPIILTQALLPALVRRKGQIVFVNSLAAHGASANNAVYAATKHGLTAIADGLREELNPQGVRVLSLYPGRTATTLQAWLHEVEGREYRPDRLLQPADVAGLLLTALDLPRTAEVTEINVRPAIKLGST